MRVSPICGAKRAYHRPGVPPSRTQLCGQEPSQQLWRCHAVSSKTLWAQALRVVVKRAWPAVQCEFPAEGCLSQLVWCETVANDSGRGGHTVWCEPPSAPIHHLVQDSVHRFSKTCQAIKGVSYVNIVRINFHRTHAVVFAVLTGVSGHRFMS